MTTESCKNGATALSHVTFWMCLEHVTIFSWMLTTAYRIVVGLRFGLWLWLWCCIFYNIFPGKLGACVPGPGVQLPLSAWS